MSVLIVIIIVDLIAVAFVMWIGSRHDAHHDIQTAEASEAVQTLRARYQAPALATGGAAISAPALPEGDAEAQDDAPASETAVTDAQTADA